MPYIDLRKACDYIRNSKLLTENNQEWAMEEIQKAKVDNVGEIKYGQWNLEARSYYVENYDRFNELVIYITATCPYCGQKHNPTEVFSKHIYAPEDAAEDFRFNRAIEEEKALLEFKQRNYIFQNYCPNCGAKMCKE